MRTNPARRLATGLTILALLAAPAAVSAAQRTSVPSPQRREPAPGVELQPLADDRNAQDTRERLHRMLEQYPPSLTQVLKLDPSLLTNPAYLAPYPGLAAFLAQHAEVAHNPAYFIGAARTDYSDYQRDPKRMAIELWAGVMAGIAGFTAVLIVISVLGWLIRTLIDYRRWLRVSRIQTEVHTKLLDRFGSNEDLLAYIQTPAGRRFLESAPIPIDAAPRTLGAPIGRILWSVQAGVVLAMGGFGLQYVSAGERVLEEVRQPLFVIGTLALALGAGFVVSAIVAYVITRQLGLFDKPPRDTAPAPGGNING